MRSEVVRDSKFLSFVLRHRPDQIGLDLDENGWADVEELIAKARAAGRTLTLERIHRAVAENDKQRFSLSEDGRRIRARQGHSVAVDLGLEPTAPPEILYHGTARRFLDSIRASGLTPGNRHHVHLSPDEVTARKVGQRHGPPVILRVRAGVMHDAGHRFFLSENGIWLTAAVPVSFLEFPG